MRLLIVHTIFRWSPASLNLEPLNEAERITMVCSAEIL